MGVVTNDERRDVAGLLRSFADKGMWGEFSDWTNDAGPTRIADLIDPDTTSYRAKTGEDTTKADREALLLLADEIERKSNDGTRDPDPMRPLATSLDLFGYARRIRDACGLAKR